MREGGPRGAIVLMGGGSGLGPLGPSDAHTAGTHRQDDTVVVLQDLDLPGVWLEAHQALGTMKGAGDIVRGRGLTCISRVCGLRHTRDSRWGRVDGENSHCGVKVHTLRRC